MDAIQSRNLLEHPALFRGAHIGVFKCITDQNRPEKVGFGFVVVVDGLQHTVSQAIFHDYYEAEHQGAITIVRSQIRSAGAAPPLPPFLLSLVIPGLGQLCRHRRLMAVAYFVLAIALWFFYWGWVIHIASAVHCLFLTRTNKEEPPPELKSLPANATLIPAPDYQDRLSAMFTAQGINSPRANYEEAVKAVFAACSWHVNPYSLTDSLAADLGLDSVDHTELIIELEEDLGIQIQDEEAQSVFNIGHLVKLVTEKLHAAR